MNKEEIATLLEGTHANNNAKPTVIRVMCKKDITLYGFFVSTGDYNDLKEKNEFRFVPRNSYKAFNDEYAKKGTYNLNYSSILKGDDIEYIEFVMPLNSTLSQPIV
jgi:hypothetical protein